MTALLTLRIALCRPPLPQLVDPNNDVSLPGEKVQICNSVLNATIPMMARTVELRHESNRLLLTASLSKVYAMLSFQYRAATIASAQTIGGVHAVDRYWGDRSADSPHSPV